MKCIENHIPNNKILEDDNNSWKHYYYPIMKKEIVEYIAKCLESQDVKVEHKNPISMLHPLPILEWKWEIIIMDFITIFHKTSKKHDVIMVFVENLSKLAHFIPVKQLRFLIYL